MTPRLALRRAVAVLAVAVTAACRPGSATTAPPDAPGPGAPIVWYSGDALAARAISSAPRDASPWLRDAQVAVLRYERGVVRAAPANDLPPGEVAAAVDDDVTAVEATFGLAAGEASG